MFQFKKLISGTIAVTASICILTAASLAYTGTGTVKVKTCLNIRSSASTRARVIGKLYTGTKVSIIGSSSGWYEISYHGSKGWVSSSYITLASSSSSATHVSSSSSSSQSSSNSSSSQSSSSSSASQSSSSSSASQNSSSSTTSQSSSSCSSSQSSSSSSISQNSSSSTTSQSSSSSTTSQSSSSSTTSQSSSSSTTSQSSSSSSASQSSSSSIQTVVDTANSMLGINYVYAGVLPTTGFDCSGLSMYCYAKAGIILPHSAMTQAAMGIEVSQSDLQIGDLVFFDTTGDNIISHVGIYIGDNNFISSESTAGLVKVGNLDACYWSSRYVTARRYIYYSNSN